MAAEDREHWNARYAEGGLAPLDSIPPLPAFAEVADFFPTAGQALEIACGRGRGAVWLAARGMHVQGYDISPVAVELAQELAGALDLSDRCTFAVADFDDGLPDGEPVDLVLCYLFRDTKLDAAMVQRIKPGGLLAISVLSEVGAGPGRFRAPAGELLRAFGHLELLAHGEGDGQAWLLGRK